MSEISSSNRRSPVEAAEAAVCLIERICPTFELIDTSSGALAGAVNRALTEIIPLVVKAPANQKKRDRWLERLWGAIQGDDVSYLALVEESWGELCGGPGVAAFWADKLLPDLRGAWSDWRPGAYVKGTASAFRAYLHLGAIRNCST